MVVRGSKPFPIWPLAFALGVTMGLLFQSGAAAPQDPFIQNREAGLRAVERARRPGVWKDEYRLATRRVRLREARIHAQTGGRTVNAQFGSQQGDLETLEALEAAACAARTEAERWATQNLTVRFFREPVLD